MQVTVLDDDAREVYVHEAPVANTDYPFPEDAGVVLAVRNALLDALEYLDEITGREGRSDV